MEQIRSDSRSAPQRVPVAPDFVEEMKKQLGTQVLVSDFERFVYGSDWSPRTPQEFVPPDLVLCPRSTEDVQVAVELCHRYGVPVTTGGGQTGMAGGAVPIYGGLYIDSTSMNQVLELDLQNETIRIQAGCTLQEVVDALEPHGYWFPHLTESKWSATVGASIAHDSDSTFGMRYGKILQFLTSVTIVTGTGQVLELGHRKAHFTSSGYKLKELIVGSEGTLGVITEATLKMEPLPPERSVEMVIFPRMQRAVDFLTQMLRAGISVEAAHINCRRRLNFYTHAYREKYGRAPDIPDWAGALLGFSLSGEAEVVEFCRGYALKVAAEMGGQLVREREIVEGWWTSKHRLDFPPFHQKWPASQPEKKFGAADPGIPAGCLEDYYEVFVQTAQKYKLDILGMNAYLEQPNSIGFSLSCALFVDYRSQDEINRFRQYFEEMARAAVDMGGTMSTYMGDTDLKVPYFAYEHGESAAMMLQIKRLFDPKGILNPGKKFTREAVLNGGLEDTADE